MKKLIIKMLTVLSLFALIASPLPVSAKKSCYTKVEVSQNSSIKPYAIEKYTVQRDHTLNNGNGSVTVYLTVGHNMTTGRMYVVGVRGVAHFDSARPLLVLNSVTSIPGIDGTITGSVKVNIKYSNWGYATWTESMYINL